MKKENEFRKMQICPKCSQNNTLASRTCVYCGSPLPSVPLLAKGTILNNRYIIMHVLGFGGFSAVYLALDQRLNHRKVAIKELLQIDPAIVQQFETEAKILASLSHPSLPKAYDWFKQFGTDRYYLVMEFVEGISVWDLVHRKGMMAPVTAMQVIDPILDVVSYLHRQNPPIIHRDIKPQNILLTRDKKIYLVDFGIAKIGGAGEKTATGAQGVTPGFSPPEQYLSSGGTDVRSDIYSLGATLYFMLTAKVPPDATARLQHEMSGQMSLEPIRSINPAVSLQIEQSVFIAMALKREQRFNSVEEFRAGLRGQTVFIHPHVPQPTPHTPTQPTPTPIQQSTPGQSLPTQSPYQQPTPPQQMPAHPLQPPIAGGVREWCPACKANFYITDPSLEWVHCPNCGQLIHRTPSLPRSTHHFPQPLPKAPYQTPDWSETWLSYLLANKKTVIRIGAIIATVSLLVLPLVSCGGIEVTGLDILQSEARIEWKLLIGLAVVGAVATLFLRNPSHCLISGIVGLASFIVFALWLRYGDSGAKGVNDEIAKAVTAAARSVIRFRYGTFGVIGGFGLIIWASYQWLKGAISNTFT